MGHDMAAALIAAVILGWGAAILAWSLGAPLWLGLVLLPGLGGPVLVLGAALTLWRPARRPRTALQPIRAGA